GPEVGRHMPGLRQALEDLRGQDLCVSTRIVGDTGGQRLDTRRLTVAAEADETGGHGGCGGIDGEHEHDCPAYSLHPRVAPPTPPESALRTWESASRRRRARRCPSVSWSPRPSPHSTTTAVSARSVSRSRASSSSSEFPSR